MGHIPLELYQFCDIFLSKEDSKFMLKTEFIVDFDIAIVESSGELRDQCFRLY